MGYWTVYYASSRRRCRQCGSDRHSQVRPSGQRDTCLPQHWYRLTSTTCGSHLTISKARLNKRTCGARVDTIAARNLLKIVGKSTAAHASRVLYIASTLTQTRAVTSWLQSASSICLLTGLLLCFSLYFLQAMELRQKHLNLYKLLIRISNPPSAARYVIDFVFVH